MKITAIIVAGGQGRRIKGPIPKAFIKLAGKSILERTLKTFDECNAITDLIVVVPKDCIGRAEKLVKTNNFLKVKKIVAGGKQRQNSVWNGLRLVNQECDLVIIHDAARPLIGKNTIDLALKAAQKFGAAVVGVPAKDTLKLINARHIIKRTPERKYIWAAQTPQVFKYKIIWKAYLKAIRQKVSATDDSKLVEDLGQKVKMVMGSYSNIKITTPEDLNLAETLLRKNG